VDPPACDKCRQKFAGNPQGFGDQTKACCVLPRKFRPMGEREGQKIDRSGHREKVEETPPPDEIPDATLLGKALYRLRLLFGWRRALRHARSARQYDFVVVRNADRCVSGGAAPDPLENTVMDPHGRVDTMVIIVAEGTDIARSIPVIAGEAAPRIIKAAVLVAA